jgi:hypothetical protein
MPKTLINGALIASKRYFGNDSDKMINGLKSLWPEGETDEVDNLEQ